MSNKKELPELAKNIRVHRQHAGISQAELGAKIGYSQQIINAYENGQRVPPTATLELFADIFHTSIDVLIGKKKADYTKMQVAAHKIMKKLKVVEALPVKDQRKVIEYVELLARANGVNG
jgi:transcriptional regulator with XRE-family HTH domain